MPWSSYHELDALGLELLGTSDQVLERPSRSSLVMTSWSPSLATSRALSSSGRRASLPLALSMKTLLQPATKGVTVGGGVRVGRRDPSVADAQSPTV